MNNNRWNDIQQDIFPNLTRPPKDYLPPALYKQSMTYSYSVQTWDEEYKMVRYHTVEDAIDYEDAADVIKHLHPEQKVIAVTKRINNTL